jgi:hypothetical protein
MQGQQRINCLILLRFAPQPGERFGLRDDSV